MALGNKTSSFNPTWLYSVCIFKIFRIINIFFHITGRKQEVIKLTEQLIAAITSGDYDAYS